MSEERELGAVVAKMQCRVVESARYNSNYIQHKVQMGAVFSQTGEDKAFTDATPSGECWMNIRNGYPALEFFKPGKMYYVTFTEAPD